MRTIDGLRALAGSADVLLCDVFGTLHDAEGVFPAAIDALARFREAGGFVLLVSNAASPGPALALALAARGIPDGCYDAVLTSADVARDMLAARAVRAVHHIGLAQERCLFDGLAVALRPVAGAELLVCTGCPDGAPPEAVLTEAAGRRLDLLCTNPDTEIVAGGRTLRFAGLVAARYQALGGRVVATGKPGPAIYRKAVRRVAAMRSLAPPVELARVVAVGDTLHLDVAGAVAAGHRALWIGQEPAPDVPYGDEVSRLPALRW